MMFGRRKPKPEKAAKSGTANASPAKPAQVKSAQVKSAQTTWHGRLEKQQMIGVVWVLHGEDEQQYELRGVEPGPDLDGQRVAVTGVLAEAGFGMQMVGTPIDVATIAVAPVKG